MTEHTARKRTRGVALVASQRGGRACCHADARLWLCRPSLRRHERGSACQTALNASRRLRHAAFRAGTTVGTAAARRTETIQDMTPTAGVATPIADASTRAETAPRTGATRRGGMRAPVRPSMAAPATRTGAPIMGIDTATLSPLATSAARSTGAPPARQSAAAATCRGLIAMIALTGVTTIAGTGARTDPAREHPGVLSDQAAADIAAGLRAGITARVAWAAQASRSKARPRTFCRA